LREKPQYHIDSTLAALQSVLRRFHEVVFADVNLPINVLWVSLRHRPGVVLEVVAAIQAKVPGALLIAHRF
jgi:hypothetical protein